MRFGVMGTGEVGTTIARGLKGLGHDVVLGSRKPDGEKAQKLADETGLVIKSHADAIAHGEWVFNALHGEVAIETLRQGEIGNKILVDIGNWQSAIEEPLETPLGEAIQAAFPKARVIKTLNNISAHLMVDPKGLGASHTAFIAGDDVGAKAEVEALLRAFGWADIIDLGDAKAFRAMENLASLWVQLFDKFKSTDFNLAVVRSA